MRERIQVSVVLSVIGLVPVLAIFLFIIPDPMVIVCISPLAFPMIFVIAYLFLAPTFPMVYRVKDPSERSASELNGLKTELEVHLDSGESLIAATSGVHRSIPTVIALTNRRLILIYKDGGVWFHHSDVEWLRWSQLSAKLSFKVRDASRKSVLEITGAHWKIEAETLASEANSRYGISHGR
jgi:hypothetical protein